VELSQSGSGNDICAAAIIVSGYEDAPPPAIVARVLQCIGRARAFRHIICALVPYIKASIQSQAISTVIEIHIFYQFSAYFSSFVVRPDFRYS
jgi:hypothetical protein